jgi:DNA-binding MarR family transcriptional regulator
MTKVYKPLLDPLGLTYPQYLVLLVLWEEDGCTVSALGERLRLDSGTLTPLLKRMASAGWLRRERDAQDERCVRIHLLDKAQALRPQALRIPERVACASACSLSEITHLTQQLQQLRQSLSDAA